MALLHPAAQLTFHWPRNEHFCKSCLGRRGISCIFINQLRCLTRKGSNSAVRITFADINWMLRIRVEEERLKRASKRTVIERRMVIPSAAKGPASDAFSSFFLEPQAQWLTEMGETVLEKLQTGASSLMSRTPVSSSENDAYDFEVLFNKLLADVVPLPSIYISVAALAFVAGAASYVRGITSQKNSRLKNSHHIRNDRPVADVAVENWLLIMSPTPFNRFVLMRCPSIAFQEPDVYEGLAEKLTTEGRHFVSLQNEDEKWSDTVLRVTSQNDEASRLSGGALGKGGQQEGRDTSPVYQRTFLHAEDGGVLAIDWPSHLELSGEHGLDTTILLVPGTADGSGDKGVQNFVQRSLRCGYFPFVLNPRGSGGSPVTTPRLFTAGDSDDVRLAIQFIGRSRPWATLMAVGWGYGANMLVKYLGEEAEATPLTAAVCIGNPFDLEDATKSVMHGQGQAFDQEMTDGFVQILKSNKMVFEGKKKGFDVQKALSATSVREFDTAISRVANGFDTLEKFYKSASSRSWIDNVKIPLLCVQNNDNAASIFSIPRHSFEGNPCTTLLLYLSRSGDSKGQQLLKTGAAACCDPLVIEWLAAVELAFLKGRHPLLQGIDITIKTPKEWNSFGRHLPSPQKPQLLDSRKTNLATGFKDGRYIGTNTLYNRRQPMHSELGEMSGPSNLQLDKEDTENVAQPLNTINQIENKKAPQHRSLAEDPENSETVDKKNGSEPLEDANMEDTVGNDEGSGEMERGQVCQAAESVMKVLDVTMPETLSAEQKQQVLDGVKKGETIVTALQEACPEEVRGKMVAALSAAVQARGISLKLVGFGKDMPAPRIPEGVKEKIQEKLALIAQSNLSVPFTGNADKSSKSDLTLESENTSEKVHSTNPPDNPSEGPLQSAEEKGKAEERCDEKQAHSSEHDAKLDAGMISQDDSMSAAESHRHKLDKEGSDGGIGGGGLAENKKREVHQGKNSEKDVLMELEKANEAANITAEGGTRGDLDEKQKREEQQVRSAENEDSADNEKLNQFSDTASVDNKTKQEGEVEKQNNILDNPDQKKDGDVQRQEKSEDIQQISKEAETEQKSEEKRSEELSSTVSTQEDQNKQVIGTKSEEALPPSSTSTQSPIPSPSINMQRAFEALTGFDDSTQMAVTNVFGVIENMIEQLEKDQQQKEQHVEGPVNYDGHQVSTQANIGNEELGESEENKKRESFQSDASVNSAKQILNGSSRLHYPQNEKPSRKSEIITQNANTSIAENSGAFQKGTQPMNFLNHVNKLNHQEFAGTDRDDVWGNEVGASCADRNMSNDSCEKSLRELTMGQSGNKNVEETYVNKIENGSVNLSPDRPILQGKSNVKRKPTPESSSGGDDVAMEYFPDENIWKFTSTNHVPSDTNSSLKSDDCSQLDEHGDTKNQEKNEAERFDAEDLHWLSLNGGHIPTACVQNAISQVVEPAYAILDDELNILKIQSLVADVDEDHEEDAWMSTEGPVYKKATYTEEEGASEDSLSKTVRELVVDALELELFRRFGAAGMENFGLELEEELARVATAVAEAARMDMLGLGQAINSTKEIRTLAGNGRSLSVQASGKMGVLHGETIVGVINSVLSSAHILARLIPAGVLVGVILAALGTDFLIVSDDVRNDQKVRQTDSTGVYKAEAPPHHQKRGKRVNNSSNKLDNQEFGAGEDLLPKPTSISTRCSSSNQWDNQEHGAGRDFSKQMGNVSRSNSVGKDTSGKGDAVQEERSSDNGHMMGAMAAAMGATAALASQSSSNRIASVAGHENHTEVSSELDSANVETNILNGMDVDKEGYYSKPNIVSSFAEKAMSVAAPVVPTKEDGGVDHERLVAILADLGQKGGILRLIGKVALLWGGLRGAMSLTDRLLVFLRVSERPLHQRLLGFILMALLLWSPVLVPLLPTLLQQWASRSPFGVANTAAVIGLYGAVVILVTIWGRTIRGYNNPLSQYGLRLPPNSKLRSLATGLAVGFTLVTTFYIVSISLGFVHFSWAEILCLRASKTAISNLEACWRLIKLVGQSFGLGLAIAVVEELLFRSWLQEEIAADLGFHKAAVLSGLAFALLHWSLPAVPGLWLLSLSLTGAKVRCNGDLDLPIGLHAGLIAGNYILTLGGFVRYTASAPSWFTGAQAGNPLAGLIGASVVGILALVLYPWDQLWRPSNLDQAGVQKSPSTS